MPAIAAVALALVTVACGGGASDSPRPTAMTLGSTDTGDDFDDDDVGAVYAEASVDPGEEPSLTRRAGTATGTEPPAINGGPTAHVQGAFGEAMPWPLIAIHVVLLPDGRVMSYGTDLRGGTGANLHYAVWDPALSGSPEAMQVLPNTTLTDIFCGGQLVLPGTGQVLLLGGTEKDAFGRGSNGLDLVALFDPVTNTITEQAESMLDRRWYATVVTTAEGDQVVLGGRGDKAYPWTPEIPVDVPATYAPTPAVYRSGSGWRSLTNATSSAAYGDAVSYGYPRAWLAPNGRVFVLAQSGQMFSLNTAETGNLVTHANRAPRGSNYLSSAMFAPGKILSLRALGKAVVVDIDKIDPVVTATESSGVDRYDGALTVLADGRVLAQGGSTERQNVSTAVYHTDIWNPQTGAWTLGASASKPRLYHSSALLLPDATVLTAGGGKPGPVRNLNAEIYYPPYLFKLNGSGELAVRPKIQAFPERSFTWGEKVSFGIAGSAQISRITLVRTGSMTHSFNGEQRFIELKYTQKDQTVTMLNPTNPKTTPPGYYMMFAFNENGIPSVAKIMRIV